MDEVVMKIGIGITTRNRPEVCRETFAIINDMRPKDSLLCIVDDNGTPPFGGYGFTPGVFKFQQHVGVGVAKNKCLELLHDAGCTHFFLFDDDCRPVVDKWWEYYTQSPLEHACWTFDRAVVGSGGLYTEYEKPNGCMLYATRKVIDMVGGWDLEFEGYGLEHVNWSDRIFNNGLTPGRYVNVPYTRNLFKLADCVSSFTPQDRLHIPHNLKLYQQKYYSKEFKPFK